MTILFVFKIILLNEHFAHGQPSVLLASGKGFSARLQTVSSRKQSFFLALEDLRKSLRCASPDPGLLNDTIWVELRTAGLRRP